MQLTPEESLLLLSCRIYLRGEDEVCIRRLANGPLDWDYVLWRSEIFRTTPLLFFHLRRLDLLEGVPEPVRFYLERWSTLSEVRAKLLYEELMPILDSFEHFGLDYFLLKGCAVSALLYPDPLVRPILDLDLMIDPEDIRIALEIMAGLGYV